MKSCSLTVNNRPIRSKTIVAALLLTITTAFILKDLPEGRFLSSKQKIIIPIQGEDAFHKSNISISKKSIDFLQHMSATYPESYETNKGGIASVAIRKSSSYHFNIQTTHQQVVTGNRLIKSIIAHKLDDVGIEYQISQSASYEGSNMTYIISWGGLLYLPII